MDNGATLYAQYLEGDDFALEQLVSAYGDGLVRFAYCFVRDSAAAEDIAEDAFATLIIRRKRFAPGASFKTYLYRIVRNKCVDYLRFNRRFTPLDDLTNVLGSTSDVDGYVEQCDRNATLYKCMQALPPDYCRVLTLTYIENFNIADASRIMRKSVKQIYNLLARAKVKLKQLLISEGLNYEDI